MIYFCSDLHFCHEKKLKYGNHDSDLKMKVYNGNGFIPIGMAQMFKHGEYDFMLSHYPTITTIFDDKRLTQNRVYNLCGHAHTSDRFEYMKLGAYNVGMEAHNCSPVSIEEFIGDIEVYILHPKQ